MLTMRPQPFFFMPGSAARAVWNAAERLIARIASHFSGGKSSTGATCWMPALLTRISTAPSSAIARFIIDAIASGLDMSAASSSTLTRGSARQPAPGALDLGRVAEAVQDEVRAVLREPRRDAEADAGGRPGDERGLACQGRRVHGIPLRSGCIIDRARFIPCALLLAARNSLSVA